MTQGLPANLGWTWRVRESSDVRHYRFEASPLNPAAAGEKRELLAIEKWPNRCFFALAF
jgi:hypothetical protein